MTGKEARAAWLSATAPQGEASEYELALRQALRYPPLDEGWLFGVNLGACVALNRLPELLCRTNVLERAVRDPECSNVADLIYIATGMLNERGTAQDVASMQALDTISFRHRHSGYFLNN
jgi:hypothetical protein